MKIKWIYLSLIYVMPAYSAQIHKCEIDGVTTFSQMPCPDDAVNKESITVKEQSKLSPEFASKVTVDQEQLHQSVTPSNTAQKDLIRVSIFQIEQQIKRHNEIIKKLKRKMSKSVSELKSRTTYANNNLAGAIYQDALSEEMIATTNKYATMIHDEERMIDDLNLKKQKLLVQIK